MRVKCLLQEHNAVLRPRLKPRSLDPESSILTFRPPCLPLPTIHCWLKFMQLTIKGLRCFHLFILLSDVCPTTAVTYLKSYWRAGIILTYSPCSLRGILVVLNVFLYCSEQSGMIPIANCCKKNKQTNTIVVFIGIPVVITLYYCKSKAYFVFQIRNMTLNPNIGEVKSACKPSGPSGQSLSQFS